MAYPILSMLLSSLARLPNLFCALLQWSPLLHLKVPAFPFSFCCGVGAPYSFTWGPILIDSADVDLSGATPILTTRESSLLLPWSFHGSGCDSVTPPSVTTSTRNLTVAQKHLYPKRSPSANPCLLLLGASLTEFEVLFRFLLSSLRRHSRKVRWWA